jgi:UDP-N-acetylglucosamine 2-epimerase (non-hydrolysing)
MNRQLISRIANIHLCPTEFNKLNLLKENVCGAIHVVGNTGLDNVTKDNCQYDDQVLVTLHRRDNHHNIDKWFNEIEQIAKKYNNIKFMIPLHPNPNIQKYKHIFKNVHVIDPMSHNDLLNYVKKCKFVISDSGGLQEECSYLNKKIIVCRKTTERPESLNIHSFLCNLPEELPYFIDKFMIDYHVDQPCPYGDGRSWEKILKILYEDNN